MSAELKAAQDAMVDLLEDFVEERGKAIRDLRGLGLEAARRADRLATMVGRPGFSKAVRAERDALLLQAAVMADDEALAIDAGLIGLVQGGIATLARVTAAALEDKS